MNPDDEDLLPVVLHWTAPAHLKSDRTPDWYWALGLIAVFGTIAAVFFGNVLFAIIIALSAVCLITLSVRQPREFEVAITPDGIHIDHEFYPYPSLHSFWVADHGPVAKLFLSTSGYLHPHIIIPLTDRAHPPHVQTYLEQYLPEESGHSLGSWLAEFLGF